MDSMGEINAPWEEVEELELPKNHPGICDKGYVRRRKMFFYTARDVRLRGLSNLNFEYTSEEMNLWRGLFSQLDTLHRDSACQLYLAGKSELGLEKETVPSLLDLSSVLMSATGVRLVPAEGLLHGRTYFGYWAHRIMPCTQYIRHHSHPEYTPEPDIVHDVIGHVPPLLHPKYARIIEEVGRLAAAITPEQLEQLVRFYWFTIEFGLLKEGSRRSILGAGILSSIQETRHVLAGGAKIAAFDLEQMLATPFDTTVLQPLLFESDSMSQIEDAVATLRDRWSR